MAWPATAHVLAMISTIVTTLVVQVRGEGMFELHLESFRNEKGVLSDDSCCNGIRPDGQCTGTCRTFFTICLKEYQAHINLNPPCTFGSVRTPVIGANTFTFPDTIQAFSNPIKLPFEFTWPGDFTLIISAFHDKTRDGSSQDSPRELISRLSTQRSVRVGDDWHQDIYPSVPTSNVSTELRYSYRVVCDEYYYGSTCSAFCKPRDDKFGHFDYSDQGQKICKPGWKGNYCDKAICLSGCDSKNGFCTGPNECQCHNGWRGKLCNECIPYPGCSEGTCNEPWQCNCREGWGGLFCNQDLNYCTNNRPCQNGSTCTNTGQGGYTCACAPGFTGTNCEREINDCLHQPCNNGGKCTDTGNDYVCICPYGFNGRHCESSATSCEETPCKNSAVCIPLDDGYKCVCSPGYAGVNCEENEYECASHPCLNGGSCIDALPEFGGYRCVCKLGYTGDRCQSNSNDCTMNPCQNGATCLDRVNEFKCQCVPGFVGPLCNINVDDCLTYPCANGGDCHDLVNDFMCTCPPGFSGKDCSHNIDECAGQPCQHGGNCSDRVNDYDCLCPTGYVGKSCEYAEGEARTTVSPPVVVPANTPRVSITNNRSAEGVVNATNTQHVDNSAITLQQLLLIVCLGVGMPIIVIVVIIVYILCNRRHIRRNRNNTCNSAHKDNEQNEITNMNNKNKKLDSNIITNLNPNTPQSLKVTNEEHAPHRMKLDSTYNYNSEMCSSSSGANSGHMRHHLNVDKPCTINKNYLKNNINAHAHDTRTNKELLEVHQDPKRPSSSKLLDYNNPQDRGMLDYSNPKDRNRPSVEPSLEESEYTSGDLKPPNTELHQPSIFFLDHHRQPYTEGMLATEV